MRGKVAGFFSVLLSCPTSTLFLAVMCFCLPLGWKAQCKIVLEVLVLLLSITPYPKAAGPQPQHRSPTVLLGPSELLSSLPSSCWEQHGLCYSARRAECPESSPSPLPPQTRLCSLGWKGGGAADRQALGCPHLHCRSSGRSQFCAVWYHISTDSKFCHGSSHKLCH